MKIQNNKGITMVILVITIIVLLIIASIVVYTGTDAIKGVTQQTLVTDMLLIQTKSKMLAEKLSFEQDESKKATILKGKPIDTIIEDSNYSKIKELVGDGKVIDTSETADYYVLTTEDLKQMNLQAIKLQKGEYYLVNYKTNEVIFSEGFKNTDEKMYYKLSEIKDLTTDKESN